MTDNASHVTLAPWSADDLPVLQGSDTPEMTAYLGGPEGPEALERRQAKFLRLWQTGEARMFTIRVDDEPDAVGSVGYWTTEWHDEPVFETGWSLHTAHQGRGIAGRAVRACLDYAQQHRFERPERDRVVAFPRVDNAASNALCARVGFDLFGEEGFEYPKGTPIRANVWVYRLS